MIIFDIICQESLGVKHSHACLIPVTPRKINARDNYDLLFDFLFVIHTLYKQSVSVLRLGVSTDPHSSTTG